MVEHTPAIALQYVRYGETSVIARFFTLQFGLQSYLVPGVRKARSRIPMACFSPLHLCEITQTHKPGRDLQRIREIRSFPVLTSLPFSPVKSAMAMVAAEILSRVLADNQPGQGLYRLTSDWILELDASPGPGTYSLLKWLWQILEPIGIQPSDWQGLMPNGLQHEIDNPARLTAFFEALTDNQPPPPLSGPARQWLFDMLIQYLRSHMDGMGSLRTLPVLRQVLGED